MAMIKCPECGHDVSEKAKKCINCGKILIEEDEEKEEIKCSECGTVLNQDDEECPNCGCPVEKVVDEKIQKVQVTSIKVNHNTKKFVIGFVIAILVCIVIGFGMKSSSRNSYVNNLKAAQAGMLVGGSGAEEVCNLTLDVWHNAIYKNRDASTDKYTRPKGFFVDFNEALGNLFSDSNMKELISILEDNEEDVMKIMKELQNPPKDLKDCYDTVLNLHKAYGSLIDLATNPSGNYNSYSSSKNEAVSDFMSEYDKLTTQLPTK